MFNNASFYKGAPAENHVFLPRTLARNWSFYLPVFVLLLIAQNVIGQCNLPRSINFPATNSALTPTGIGDTARSNSAWAGFIHYVNVQQGNTYVISACNNNYAKGTSIGNHAHADTIGFDPMLSLYQDTSTISTIQGKLLIWTDSGCGTGSIMPKIEYTATFTGRLAFILDSTGICDRIITDATNVFVTQIPNSIKVALNPNHITCNGLTNGSIASTTKNASGSVSYLWSNGDTTASISGLSAGAYSLTVTDSLGNKDSATVTITQPAAFVASINQGSSAVVCANSTVELSTPNQSGVNYQWVNQADSSWVKQPAGLSNSMENPKIAMLNGVPYVSFSDNSKQGRLTVKKLIGSNWVLVDTAGFTSSKVIDYKFIAQNNKLYIAYQDASNGNKASVLVYNGNNWSHLGASTGFSKGAVKNLDIAADSNNVYVAYLDSSAGNKATVMKYSNSTWDSVGVTGFSPSWAFSAVQLALNKGNVYFNYRDRYGRNHVYSYQNSSWSLLGGSAGKQLGVATSSILVHKDELYLIFTSYAGVPTLRKFDGSNWVNLNSNLHTPGSKSDLKLYSSGNSIYLSFKVLGQPKLEKITNNLWQNLSASLPSKTVYRIVAAVQNGTLYYVFNQSNRSSEVHKYVEYSANANQFTIAKPGTYYLKATNANNCTSTDTITVTQQTINASILQGDTACFPVGDSVLLSTSQTVGYNFNWAQLDTFKYSLLNKPNYTLRSFAKTSLVFDKDNTPYVAFVNSQRSNTLSVVKLVGDTWVSVGAVSLTNYRVRDAKIAIDDNKTLYVAFNDYNTTSKISVIKYVAGAWVNVGLPNFASTFSSDFDFKINNNKPYLAFVDALNGQKIKLQSFNGTSWSDVGGAFISSSSATAISLDFDSKNIPYIAFSSIRSSSKAYVMKYDGSTWNTLGSGAIRNSFARNITLKINNVDVPYLVYTSTGSSVYMSSYSGGAWNHIATNPSVGNANNLSFEFDQNNLPYVLFEDGGRGSKQFVYTYDGTSWNQTGYIPNTGTLSLANVNLAFDNNNQLHLSFVNSIGGYILSLVEYSNRNNIGENFQTFTSDSANHILTVTDTTSGCSASDTIMVVPCLTPTATIMLDSAIKCNGDANAQLSVIGKGGTLPLKFVWSNGDTATTISNLAAGTYKVTVTDSKMETDTVSFTISQPDSLSINLNVVKNVSCFNGSDGEVNYTLIGGTRPYYASTSNGDTIRTMGLNSNHRATNLPNFYVYDANGCRDSVPYIVTQPAKLVATAIMDSLVACYGASTGKASVAAVGGTMPYKYAWNNNDTTAAISGLRAGRYLVTVTDSNNCTDTSLVEVTEQRGFISRGIIRTNVSCFGGNNGTLTPDVHYATPPYSYAWSNNDTAAKATGLIAGSYTVTITDSLGCFLVLSQTITQPTAVVATATVDSNVTCKGRTDGVASATATGGTGSYTFKWSNNDTTSTARNLAIGGYRVTVTDSLGCTGTDTITVGYSGRYVPPVVTFPNPNAICNNDSLLKLSGATPTGGVYSGKNVSSGEFDPASAGAGTDTLYYTYTDTIGCITVDTATILVNAFTPAQFSSLSDVCIDASAFALAGGMPTGGVYSGKGVNAGNFNPDSAGVGLHTIKYTYTDANNCVDTATQTQTVDTLPVVTVIADSNWCLNAAPLKLNGGMPRGGSYLVNGVADTMYSATVSGIDTLIYTYTDTNRCTSSDTAFIRADSVPVVTFASMADVCVGSPSVSLTQGLPLGGMYSGNNVSGSLYNPKTVKTDTLTYTYTDSNKCTGKATQTITVNALPVVSIATQNDVCENVASVGLSGGAPAGGSYSGNGVTGGNFNPANAGLGSHTITYTYTDGNKCVDSAKTPIRVAEVTLAKLNYLGYSCENHSAINLAPHASPSGGSFTGTGINGNNFDPTLAGTGSHKVTYSFTNGDNCTDTASRNLIVEAIPVFSIEGDTVGCGTDEKAPLLRSWIKGMTYHWSTGSRVDSTKVTKNGRVWLKVTDPSTQKLCSSSDTISVNYQAECVGLDEAFASSSIQYYPNPNQGVFNYRIEGLEYSDLQMTILSVNGQVVYTKALQEVKYLHEGSIDLGAVENGIYFVYLTSSKGRSIHKITVNK